MNGIVQKFGDSGSDGNLLIDNLVLGVVGNKNGQNVSNNTYYPIGCKIVCALASSGIVYEKTASGLNIIKTIVGIKPNISSFSANGFTIYCTNKYSDFSDFSMIVFK